MDARLEFNNNREIEIELERLRDAGYGPGTLRLMQNIGRYMKTSTQLRFRRQMDPEGRRWIPSQPAIERGGQTLRDTNRLFRSITWRAGLNYAEAGTNVVYAKPHQFGVAKIVNVREHTRMGRRGFGDGAASVKRFTVRAHTRPMLMHQRAFLGFSIFDRSQILGMIRQHLQTRGK